MATKISELTAASTLDGSELIPVVQGGVTKQATITDLVSGGELPAYSTSETLTTERWTDGKPIYRKVVAGSFVAQGVVAQNVLVSADVDAHVNATASAPQVEGHDSQHFGQHSNATTNYYSIVWASNRTSLTSVAQHSSWANQPWSATLYYTKTTDTAASPVAGVTVTGSPEYLDGTWTPVVSGSSTPGTYTVAAESLASFVKIGRQVTLNARILITAVSGGSGNIKIGGLPYAVANDATQDSRAPTGAVYLTNVDLVNANPASISMYPSSTTELSIIESSDNTSWIATTITGITGSNAQIRFSISYLTDA